MELPITLLEASVERGAIFHSTMFDYIEHGKFFVVIGQSEEQLVGFFFVNTKINSFMNNKPDLLAMQYVLKRSDYSFLNYDSYLCCTEITKISKSKLLTTIQSGETIVKGVLTDSDRDGIIALVRGSKLFTPRDKKLFFR